MRFLVFAFLLVLGISLSAQSVVNVKELSLDHPKGQNIVAEKLFTDSLSSTFLISIRDSVPLHIHALHTEQVLILKGKGIMQIGSLDGTKWETRVVKPGDWVILPKGVPHSVLVRSKRPLQVISIQAPEFNGTDRIPYKR